MLNRLRRELELGEGRDPLLVDVGNDSFTPKSDSPALKLGFVPLDLGEVPPAKE